MIQIWAGAHRERLEINMKKQLLILVALFGLLLDTTAQSEGGVSPPEFLNIMRTGSGAMLQWKADTGSTQWVERVLD